MPTSTLPDTPGINNTARWIADLMKADGLTVSHLEAMTEEDRTNAVLAYLDTVGAKITNMQSQLLTRPQSLPAFRAIILSIL